MSSTVLVLGAAGRLGQAVSLAFADAGWSVRAQSRKALPAALAAHPRVTAVACDALDTARLTEAASGAEVIVNTLNPLYTEWDRLALPLADAALGLARSSGALLMLPGNVYNFGRELPARLDLATPERGDIPKARIRIEIEARMAAAAGQGVRSVVVRAGDFYGGAGTGTWFDLALATKLAKGRFVYPGPMDVPHAWAYLPDLARVFVSVAERRAQIAGHRRVHFGGHTATGTELMQAVEAATGRPLRAATLPWPLIRVGALVMPMWRELLVMRYLWQRPHALDDTALRSLIGEVPATPLRDAVAATLRGLDVPLAQPADSPLIASARS